MDKQNAQNRKNTTHENCGRSQDAQNTTTQTQTQKQNKKKELTKIIPNKFKTQTQ